MPAKLTPYTDAAGNEHWVEVSAELHRALEAFDRNVRRRDALFRRNHRLRTGEPMKRGARRNGKRLPPLVGFLNVELEAAFRALYPREGGNPWEGPRLSFTHYLGESPTWPGPEGMWVRDGEGFFVCRLCGGARLETHQYCLNCDRHGREGK